jgi:hypothetical protein
MKKIILMLLSILLISIFLVSCVKEVSDDKLKAELKNLSEEELNEIIKEGNLNSKSPTGEAYANKFISVGKYAKVSIKRTVKLAKEICFSGCYYGNLNVKIADSLEDCQSYALAFKYADLYDVLRIIKKENPNHEDFFNREIETLLNYDNPEVWRSAYKVKYKDCLNKQESYIEVDDFVSDTDCANTNFFGINLYCFNKVTEESNIIKKNNFQSIISPLTFLKLSGTEDMYNPLTRDNVKPFDFLVQEKIKYVDGTNIYALNMPLYGEGETVPPVKKRNEKDPAKAADYLKLNDIKCLEEGWRGAANFQFRDESLTEKFSPPEIYTVNQTDSGEPYPPGILENYIEEKSDVRNIVFYCKDDVTGGKIHYAGISYHEGNHKFQGGHVYNENCEKNGRMDKSWRSVFGAHVTYLFQASQNEQLESGEKCELYKEAINEQSKLCDYESLEYDQYVVPKDCINPSEESIFEFARCLTREEAEMYGASWCSACILQKRMFGDDAFNEINYIDCSDPGLCPEINAYPTWKFADGSILEGKREFAELAEITGC